MLNVLDAALSYTNARANYRVRTIPLILAQWVVSVLSYFLSLPIWSHQTGVQNLNISQWGNNGRKHQTNANGGRPTQKSVHRDEKRGEGANDDHSWYHRDVSDSLCL